MRMITQVQRVSLPEEARLLMISDLHGHGEGLLQLLQKAQFTAGDVLVIAGDLVDKGPKSLETLRTVMRLCSKYTVYVLMGNVDLWRLERLMSEDAERQQELLRYSLRAQETFGSCLLSELCDAAEIPFCAEMDTQTAFPQIRECCKTELDFLAGLPTILDTQNITFVHGGLPHENLNELEGADCRPLLKWDHFWQDGLSFEKCVAVGHWPTALYQSEACHLPIIDRERHIICMDGGCGLKVDGQLNLLVLPSPTSTDFQLYTWCPLPTIIAQDAQAECAASVYIHWGDHQIMLLEQDQETAVILHHGRKLSVPAQLIYQSKGANCCDDYTDYRHAVAPGERLKLVYETAQGCYVKKNGRSGWYTGRYQKAE